MIDLPGGRCFGRCASGWREWEEKEWTRADAGGLRVGIRELFVDGIHRVDFESEESVPPH